MASLLQKFQGTVRGPVVEKDMIALLVDGNLLEEVVDLMLLNNSPLEGEQNKLVGTCSYTSVRFFGS